MMLESVSERKLDEVWLLAVMSAGRFEQVGDVQTRRAGTLQMAEVVLQFEAGDFAGRLAIDDSARVQGLLVFDPDHAAQNRLPF